MLSHHIFFGRSRSDFPDFGKTKTVKTVLVLLCISLLCSCRLASHRQQRLTLMRSPQRLNTVLSQCRQQSDKNSDNCLQAKLAYQELLQLVRQYQRQGGLGFGKAIMTAQNRLVRLEQQRVGEKDNRGAEKLNGEIETTRQSIRRMLALIYVLEHRGAALNQLLSDQRLL